MTSGSPAPGKPAFDRFITADQAGTDLQGLVAYGLYKTLKRGWSIRKGRTSGRSLTREEADEYLDVLTDELERQLKNDAASALKIFAAQAVEDATLSTIRTHLGKDTFWKDVQAGVVAAFLWSLILVVVGLIIAFSNVDVFNMIEAVHKAVHPA